MRCRAIVKGIDEGESAEDAITRELFEEAGLLNVEVGPVIWECTHLFPLSPDFDGQRGTLLLIRAGEINTRPEFSRDELRPKG